MYLKLNVVEKKICKVWYHRFSLHNFAVLIRVDEMVKNKKNLEKNIYAVYINCRFYMIFSNNLFRGARILRQKKKPSLCWNLLSIQLATVDIGFIKISCIKSLISHRVLLFCWMNEFYGFLFSLFRTMRNVLRIWIATYCEIRNRSEAVPALPGADVMKSVGRT